MTAAQPNLPRRLACARCGAVFDCSLSGGCWCAAAPYRVRVIDVAAQQDCLCPDCLREAATSAVTDIASRNHR